MKNQRDHLNSCAIYPGSFDPWSVGHQYVLNSALKVFKTIYVLLALNPAKQGKCNTLARLRLIAHHIDPLQDWLNLSPPFEINKRIRVTYTEGLVADFARGAKIEHLVRGLRSTSDFEAEFNLYFSNKAIFENIETWAIMCPPSLLHCSSSYVRTVIGKQGVSFVGTSFLAQCIYLGAPPLLGECLDAIETLSQHRFSSRNQDISAAELSAKLQLFFTRIANFLVTASPELPDPLRSEFWLMLANKREELKKTLASEKYPEEFVATLWALLVKFTYQASRAHAQQTLFKNETACLTFFQSELGSLGKSGLSVMPIEEVRSLL